MAAPLPAPSDQKYDLGFANWVYDNIDGGDKLSLCMQCGVCSGSCPIGTQMDHGPRKLFMMIRAGMKEAVMTSNTMWSCTSCYNCVVRCPRGVPVTYILQDLASKAVELGYAAKEDNTRFASAFWWSARAFGRTDERLVTAKYYFSKGFVAGIKLGLANLKIALGMIRTKRMPLGAPHKIKDTKGLKAILDKALEIERRDAGGAQP
jgi:quinone-modifying oxidoreductase subunit QmoC